MASLDELRRRFEAMEEKAGATEMDTGIDPWGIIEELAHACVELTEIVQGVNAGLNSHCLREGAHRP